MPSSTSSSDERLPKVAFGRLWLAVIGLALSGAIAAEGLLRFVGYSPAFLDDRDAWAQRRAVLAEVSSPRHVLVLGSSRAQTDFDPRVFRRALPEHGFTMLAVSGRQPFATLRDVALETDFRGLVLVTATAENYPPSEAQQPWVDHYEARFRGGGRFERSLNRDLKTWLQQRLVIAYPPLASVLRTLREGRYAPRGTVSEPSGRILNLLGEQSPPFQAAVLAQRDRRYRERLEAGDVSRSDADWPAYHARYRPLVERIRARGGEVVFVVPPTSHARLLWTRQAYPRDRFMGTVEQGTGAGLFHFEDDPVTRTLSCPDNSHLAPADAAIFSRAVLRAVRAAGRLPGEERAGR